MIAIALKYWKLGLYVALASILLGGGYKIGSWKAAAEGGAALAQCKLDLSTQRESDLSGANHALSDELTAAIATSHADALALQKLAADEQTNSVAFQQDSRTLYAKVVGGCTLTSDFVSVLAAAGGQANRHGASARAAGTAVGGHAATPVLPHPAGKPLQPSG